MLEAFLFMLTCNFGLDLVMKKNANLSSVFVWALWLLVLLYFLLLSLAFLVLLLQQQDYFLPQLFELIESVINEI